MILTRNRLWFIKYYYYKFIKYNKNYKITIQTITRVNLEHLDSEVVMERDFIFLIHSTDGRGSPETSQSITRWLISVIVMLPGFKVR